MTFNAYSRNLAQGDSRKDQQEVHVLVAFAKFQKLINWAQIIFNNLHSSL
jgi:hypothetical protein